MFCALLTSRYQVSVYRTNGPVVSFSKINSIFFLKIFQEYHQSVILNSLDPDLSTNC